jgi:hypothetical protein
MFSRRTFALIATVLVSVLIGLLTGCSPPAGTGGGGDGDGGVPAPRSFSGVVYDAVSGEPIPGVEVSLGWDSDTTDPGGAFEFVLNGPYTVRSEAFCVAAPAHTFLYVETLDVDTSVDTALSLPLERRDSASYTDRTAVRGNVYHAPGVEIAEGAISVSIYGANGTFEEFDGIRYEDAGSYIVHTAVPSADSLVVVEVRDVRSGGLTRPDFVFYSAGVDLASAGAGPVTVDVARPPATDYVPVRLLGGDAGDAARAYYRSSYGQVPCWFLPKTAAGAPDTSNDILGTLELAGGAGQECTLYNPSGWPNMVLVHGREDVGEPVGHARHWLSASPPQAAGGDVTLADLEDALGPFWYPDLDSLRYDEGTLAVDAVAGADLYVHRLDAADGPVGTVIARSAQVQLPGVLLTQLGGLAMTDSLLIQDLGSPSLPPSFLESRDVPASLRLGEVYGTASPYERAVNVPPGGTVTIGLE